MPDNFQSNSPIVALAMQGKWPEVLAAFDKLSVEEASELIAGLPDEQQQKLFSELPVDVAAAVLGHLPYYLQYVLLHTRPQEQIRTILDAMEPNARIQLFDELPEEAWQKLSEEAGDRTLQSLSPPVEAMPAPDQAPRAAPVPQKPKTEVQPKEAIMEARAVEKSFIQPDGKSVQVIAPLDLAIYPGTIVALLGASGSGKSTLLRMLSGLSQPSSGNVFWHGRNISEATPNVAIVFQSFALFPWLTVLENVEAPLLARAATEPERRKRALRAISTVGLKGFANAYPKELSGGMKQRVGFARALAVEPEVLFMDEPFSALDVLTAENLRGELLDLWTARKLNIQTIFIVTHNIEEAVLLADRVIVLGRNPAYIRADFHIPLEQPRNRKSPQFLIYVDYIYKVMTQPDIQLAPPSPEKARYPLLPHARPGGIAGLLEVLVDQGGSEDLYHLAEKLLLEIDDLLPITDAATLLGFVRVQEGDVEVTPAGRAWAEADIEAKKKLFREAVLARLLLFQQIVRVLEQKSDRSIPLELFTDILEEHYPEESVQRQLETVLHWGRYCELFSYNSEEERIYLITGQETQVATELPPEE